MTPLTKCICLIKNGAETIASSQVNNIKGKLNLLPDIPGPIDSRNNTMLGNSSNDNIELPYSRHNFSR